MLCTSVLASVSHSNIVNSLEITDTIIFRPAQTILLLMLANNFTDSVVRHANSESRKSKVERSD